MSSPPHNAFIYLGIAVSFVPLAYILWLYARAYKNRPNLEPKDIAFQERSASGCSQKNILTKLGGARNCLRLVVTKNFLWVTSWFPFSLLTSFYDLEHVIPLDAIVSVRKSSFLGSESLLLTFRDSKGEERTLRLLPKQPDAFIQSLGVKLDQQTSAQ